MGFSWQMRIGIEQTRRLAMKIGVIANFVWMAACTPVNFTPLPTIEKSLELCGGAYKGFGPQILTPAEGQPVGPFVTIEGTCEGTGTVSITGGGLNEKHDTICVNNRFSRQVALTSGDGVKDLLVAQEGIVGKHGRCLDLDTTAPKVVIRGPDLVNNLTPSIIGDCESGLDVEIRNGATGPVVVVKCVDGTFSAPVPVADGDGKKEIVARQKDPVGNIGKDDGSLIVDMTPPKVVITTPAVDTVVRNEATIGGTCEAGLPVRISGSAPKDTVVTQCTDGTFEAHIQLDSQDGRRTVVAEQTDAAGNSARDERAIIRDTTPPTIRITGPDVNTPARNGVTVVGTCEGSGAVTVGGTGAQGQTIVACNNGNFSAPVTFSNGDGTKNVVVAQPDAVGNIGTDNRDFVRDSAPPLVKITSPAANTAANSGLTVSGTCEVGLPVAVSGSGITNPSTVACNNGSWGAGVTFTAGDGVKNVAASQTDLAGNIGTDNRDFVRDSTAPAIRITGPAAGTPSRTGVTVVGDCSNGIPVQVSGAGVAQPSTVTCTNGRFSAPVEFPGADGVKNVVVSQTSPAGNMGSDNRDFMKDTTPPMVKITSPDAGTINRMGLTISGTCEAGLPVQLAGTGIAPAVTASCANGAFSAPVTFSANDGVKNITATQTDAAGNVGTDNRDFMKDSTPPAIKITAPDAGTSAQTGVRLVGTCTDGLPVAISGTGVAAPSTTACTNGQFSSDLSFSSGDGTKNVIASQTDMAGNVGSDNRDFVRDTSGPAIQITGPAAGTPAQNGLTVVGNCTTGLPVAIGGTGVNQPSTVTCNNGTFSAPVVFSAGDGTKTVMASQTDLAGNMGSDSRDFLKDTGAPLVQITAPSAGTVAQTGVTLVGNCTTGLPVSLTGAGIAAPMSVGCDNGTFTTPISFSSGDGVKTVTASQTDAAGNTGTDSRNFERDTTPPTIKITGPAAGTPAKNGVTVVGDCTTGLTVTLAGTGSAASVMTSCTNARFSADVAFSNGDGTKNITASQTDMAGNTGSDNRDFLRNNVGPAIKITGPAAGSNHRSGVTLVGTCTNGLPIAVAGAGNNAAGTATCSNGAFSTSVSFTDGEGTKNIVVSQTDAAGNIGTDNRDFVKDSIAPLVRITAPAAGTVAQTGVSLVGTCESGLPVQLSGTGLAAASTATCENGQFASNVSFSSGDGTKNVVATQTDAAGNSGSDNRDFVRDTTPPSIRITGPAAGTPAQSGVTLIGTCTDGLPVAISGTGVGMGTTTACNGGQFSTPINFSAGDGTKNVIASQTDAAGNTGSDNRNFIRNNAPPAIQITAPAAGTPSQTGVTVVGNCTAGLPVAVSGSGNAATSTVTCASGTFSAPVSFTAGDGTKNIVVAQTDAAGNVGTDNRDFVRDTTPPDVKITAPDAGTVGKTGLTVSGTCTNGLPVALGGAGLSAAGTATCTNGAWSAAITFSNGDGVKTVTASQTDAAGNTGTDSRNFERDTTPPTIQITAPAAGTPAKSGITLVGNCTNGLPVAISGTGAAGASTAACTNGQFSTEVTFSNGDGVKNIVASQTDAAGNVGSDNRDFIKTNAAPGIRITGPAAGSNHRTGLTLVGQCVNGLPVAVSGAGVNAPSTAACSNGAFSTPVTFSDGEGTKNIVVSQTDVAGNVGTDNRDFVKDTIAPLVKITAPAAGTTAQTGLTVSGTCEAGLPVNLAGAGLSAPGPVTCASGTWSAAITFSNGDGVKTITASQTDAAGNTGTDSRDFVRDTTGPAIKITAPAAGTTSQTGVTVVGTCTDGYDVNVSGTGVAAPSTVSCGGGQFSANISFSNGDGTKAVTVAQTDEAGNTGTDSRNFVRDTTAPLVRITAPAANSNVGATMTISGTCEAGLPVQLAGPGIAMSGPVTCQAGGTFSGTISISAGDGAKTITATQTDAAGNTGTDSRTFQRDSTGPAIQITGPAPGTAAQTGVTLVGTCETGLSVTVGGAGVASQTTVACNNGQFSTPVSFSNGDGAKVVSVAQTDAAGNTGTDSRSFNRDTTAPLVRITAPAAGTSAQTGLTISGTCEAGLPVNLSGTGLAAPGPVSCASGTWSANITFSNGDGTKNIIASQTDAVGNTGTDNRNFVRDNAPPAIDIVSPTAGTTVTVATVTVSGTCEAALAIAFTGDIAAVNGTCSASSTFSQVVTLSAGDGAKTIRAAQTDALGNSAFDTTTVTKTTLNQSHEVFTADASEGKVDILFVDDNSASMEFEQRKLGQRFTTFIWELMGVDWQVGITTTDCSTGKWGVCGSLLQFEGLAQKILSPAIAGYADAFLRTIERPETVDCVARGECPSGLEEALKAAMTSMDKRNGDNAGFFRNGAALAVVVLTDEDERSTGPANATKAQQVVEKFQSIWGMDKKLKGYAITVLEGDTACLQMQKDQQGGIGAYGTHATAFANLTGGRTGSICAADYSSVLQNIGSDVRSLTSAVTLTKAPVAASVNVVFTPNQAITWTVKDKTILFSRPVPPGTKIDVYYDAQ